VKIKREKICYHEAEKQTKEKGMLNEGERRGRERFCVQIERAQEKF
jgi:hypothetical protein